jgi:hypothetical protein
MTEKSSLDLFRQALSEGLSNRFDSLAEEYTGEIVCSRKHKLAMRTIVYGKAGGARAWSPRMRRVVAILVAAALLLTSCGIIFREEIREVFDELFVSLNYGEHGKEGYSIEKIYKLGYVPEGYVLEEEIITKISVNYKYINRNGFSLYFEQRPIIGLDYTIDSEEGYSKLENFEEIKVYYRVTSERHHYIWSDGKYSMKLNTSEQLTDEEIILIIEEITTK